MGEFLKFVSFIFQHMELYGEARERGNRLLLPGISLVPRGRASGVPNTAQRVFHSNYSEQKSLSPLDRSQLLGTRAAKLVD